MRSVLPFALTLLATAMALAGCENCGPSAEPLVRLSVRTPTAARLDTLYAPGSLRPLPTQPSSLTTTSATFYQFVVPLNITTDSTRYVVQFGGQRDTITVFCQRKTAFRNRTCGYVLDLYAPANGPTARTTSGQVEGVSYVQNRNASFGSGKQDTGIYVSVRL